MVTKMKEFAAEILEPKNIRYKFEERARLADITLDVEKRKNLFLIFKESINNAAKYSEGSEVVISIGVENNTLKLSVRDNGKGFEKTRIRSGNGLVNMAERARMINGRLVQLSEPGKGTEIVAELPVT
jgi:signal transduction histidine kinase